MSNKNYKPKSIEWFKDRIGKKIYRDKLSCPCETCEVNGIHGLIVEDELHANYLSMIDADFAAEGTFCNYRDIK